MKKSKVIITLKVEDFGNRSKNINKYKDDAEILENAYFNENKNNSLKFRYAYYCAQSYRDANIVDKSIHWFHF